MSNNPTSEKFTFRELISKHKIEIPIIQRDYAQGRAGQSDIRTNFLTALVEVVNGKKLELDFIYGSVKDGVLQPLDGQQRLTTLFLLHWFVAIKENKLDDELKNLLTKFTYETRASSREFCNDLIKEGIDFNNLLETDYHDKEKTKPKNNELSKTIIDSSWFFLSWKRDPTIKSMLTMLDSIQQMFKNKTEVWDKFNNISFHYIELQDFGLSDDLYIKMNARGKALTDFENFKAKFEQYITKVIYEIDEKGNEILENGERVVLKANWEKELEFKDADSETEKKEKQQKQFSYRIDTLWTDLFWHYRDKTENIFDDSILKFMANTAIVFYAKNLKIFDDKNEQEATRKKLELKGKSKNITDEAINRERIEKRIENLSKDYRAIRPIDFVSKEGFQYLKKCFDIYSKNNNDKVNVRLTFWDNKGNNLFAELVDTDNSTTYNNRVLFYAQTIYLKVNEMNIDVELMAEWMRVVRNIVENATIDSAATFIGAINLIKELSNGCNAVYDFLSKNVIQSKFAEEQVKEEIRKAKLIVYGNEIKEIIFKLEDTSFCKGSINWCLECSEKVEELKKIKGIIDLQLSENDVSNLFRRALLTIGNNHFYHYWGSWSYNTNSQKRCLIENRNDLKNRFTNGTWLDDYLKPLITQLFDNNLKNIVDNYECPDGMPNWKKRLIKEDSLLDRHCENHYVGIPNSGDFCYLFGTYKRPTLDDCYKLE